MGSTAVEKTEEELRNEIDELLRQQREITERLRDPRGLRRGALSAPALRSNGVRQRPFLRPGDRNDSEDQPPAKRRLSSAVVKVDDGELPEDADAGQDDKTKDSAGEGVNGTGTVDQSDRNPFTSHQTGWTRRDSNQRTSKAPDIPSAEHVPRVLPKNEDPSLVNRNKRMLGQLLGTLEKFRKEDMQLSGTEAYMRRSNSLQRAEQRAREESERLRKEEREQIAEKRRRDLTLRARVAAKTEEKKLELLFLRWSEHHKRLSNFIRTKAEPPIYYLPNKPLDEDPTSLEKRKEEAFLEWKNARREEVSEYQKQIGEQYLANVEKELERWQNARNARKVNNDQNLQETMDKELDTHRLEHGPKKRKIPGGNNNEDDDDVEDINVGEDDMMDDELDDEAGRRIDETTKAETANTSADPAADTDTDNVDRT
ncbi:pinin [Abrus precatorius]|uniref:Pinin n=1 Tax=Abrus precatorius TaxID=3816 RepID=A0A8B8MJX7_ABRPR|nr:pinin [Abrus precatorius]